MARIGVFGLNLSPKSGGVFSLIEGLMAHAAHSRHTYLYVTQARPPSSSSSPPARLPSNVQLLERPAAARVAAQGALKVPGLGATLFRYRRFSVATLSAVCGISPRVFAGADLWLWPHCFVPVPRLGRTVAICHDMIHRHHPDGFSRLSLVIRRQAERSLQHCAAVVCPSQSSASDLVGYYPALAPLVRLFSEAPCEVLPESAHAEETGRLEARFGQMPLFLFVAVDWPHKNHALLIDAAVALRGRVGRQFRVVFAGHRRTGAVAAAIRSVGAGDVVADLGPVSRATLAALYRHSAALLYPSLCEGFGIPLVEAMQYGLPIIASDRSCLPEVCGEAAVLLSPDSQQLWVEQMQRLLERSSYRDALAARSRERGAIYGWERTWRELDEAFAAALAAVPCRASEASRSAGTRSPAPADARSDIPDIPDPFPAP